MSPKRSRSPDQPEIKGSAKKRPRSSAEDEPEIMYAKVRYQYTSDRKKYDEIGMIEGLWSNAKIPVTFLEFERSSQMSEVFKSFQKLNHVSIPRVLGQLEEGNTLVVERILPTPIMDWLKHDDGLMWTVDSKGKKFLELERRHSIVFRGIVMALAYLHAKGICHGNLENGIFVTDWAEENPRICLANFNTTADFGDGFKRDLQSLEYLVKTSVYYHCNQIKKKNSHPQEPAALVAFYDLFHQLESCENFEQMREFATFIYWAPVFYDWKDRRDFLICVDKFSNQAEEWFRRKLITSHSLSPKMLNWATRLNNLASDHLVVKLYDYEKNSKSYDYSGGLYLLHRNGLHHCMGTKDKDAIQRAMEELLRIFPEALSEIFAALIARFHFHKHDAFGKDLVMFLKEADNLRG